MSDFIYPKEPMHLAAKPVWGQKEPAHSTWFTHDPAIYHDPVSKDYFLYCTDAKCMRSHDMIVWETLGKAVEKPPKEAIDWTGSDAIWAPDIVKVGDEYRLYCSNSSFGSQRSCIFLAVSDKADGPFIPKGVVFRSDESMPVNAIDANIIEDVRNGKQYMVYGSFWGGCHIIELDKETGFARDTSGQPGICLARRPLWTDGAIEGPYIIYNEKTDYYYLFVSYASLRSDYNIRVGRSRNVTGPYLDHNGRNMTDLDDGDCSIGYMPACGYKFDDDPVGFMGRDIIPYSMILMMNGILSAISGNIISAGRNLPPFISAKCCGPVMAGRLFHRKSIRAKKPSRSLLIWYAAIMNGSGLPQPFHREC